LELLPWPAISTSTSPRPATFEHALNHLVDRELDLSRFDARYKNDLTGASAYAFGVAPA
jgi:hypothetical protein